MIKKRVLITGANGLLGQELVRQMSHENRFHVLATGCDPSSRLTNLEGFSYTPLDVCSKPQVQSVLKEFCPHYVINCAAFTGVDDSETQRDQCWRVNADAVRHLATSCRHHRSHLVQISTDFVFDGQCGPYREHDRPNPINYYGKSKLAGENEARAAGGEKLTIVRTNIVFGVAQQLDRLDFVGWVLNNLHDQKKIHVFSDQWRTPTYTYDLAIGILRLVHFQKNGVYNLSGREFMSMYEFSVLIAEVFDLDPTFIQSAVQHTKPQAARRPPYTGLVTLKSETEIDFRPLPLKQALTHLRDRLDASNPWNSTLDA
ncbi:MAG: dTDP-4-dehydrorhamnose reductase [Bacteroidetes bacterium]|nr:dTDP-4-dehydrorhamnose reductase [Bacteroidota bacterium]